MPDRNKHRWFVGIITNCTTIIGPDDKHYTRITAESIRGFRRAFRPAMVKIAYVAGDHDYPVGSEIKWHANETETLPTFKHPPFYINLRVIVTIPTTIITSPIPEALTDNEHEEAPDPV